MEGPELVSAGTGQQGDPSVCAALVPDETEGQFIFGAPLTPVLQCSTTPQCFDSTEASWFTRRHLLRWCSNVRSRFRSVPGPRPAEGKDFCRTGPKERCSCSADPLAALRDFTALWNWSFPNLRWDGQAFVLLPSVIGCGLCRKLVVTGDRGLSATEAIPRDRREGWGTESFTAGRSEQRTVRRTSPAGTSLCCVALRHCEGGITSRSLRRNKDQASPPGPGRPLLPGCHPGSNTAGFSQQDVTSTGPGPAGGRSVRCWSIEKQTHRKETARPTPFPRAPMSACQWCNGVSHTALVEAFHRGLHGHEAANYSEKHRGKGKVWARAAPEAATLPPPLRSPRTCFWLWSALHTPPGRTCALSLVRPLPANRHWLPRDPLT